MAAALIRFTVLCTFALILLKGDAAKSVQDVTNCINSTLTKELKPKYSDEYKKLRSLDIPRIKQALQSVMKTENVVVTAPNGQMTVNEKHFAKFASGIRHTKVGKAMITCKGKPDAERMYLEAARATQCIFEEMKTDCQK